MLQENYDHNPKQLHKTESDTWYLKLLYTPKSIPVTYFTENKSLQCGATIKTRNEIHLSLSPELDILGKILQETTVTASQSKKGIPNSSEQACKQKISDKLVEQYNQEEPILTDLHVDQLAISIHGQKFINIDCDISLQSHVLLFMNKYNTHSVKRQSDFLLSYTIAEMFLGNLEDDKYIDVLSVLRKSNEWLVI